MVHLKNEMRIEDRPNLRGGEGTVSFRHLFSQEEMDNRARLCAKMILPPGASVGAHPHEGEREIYYILKGKALFTEDGRTYELGPGDASLTGGGGTHGIANAGDEPLEVLAIIILD